MERRPLYGMSSNFTGVHVVFFEYIPYPVKMYQRLRNGRFRRNLAYNRPRQYDLFEDAICNVFLSPMQVECLSRF